jgi:hypothetical protein
MHTAKPDCAKDQTMHLLDRPLVTRTGRVRYEDNGPHLLVVPAGVREGGLAHEVRLVIVQISLLPPLEKKKSVTDVVNTCYTDRSPVSPEKPSKNKE